MDGSGLFSLSACEQIEKFEEWVEVPVSKILQLLMVPRRRFPEIGKYVFSR